MSKYLDLLESCLAGTIYQDKPVNLDVYSFESREVGGDWPSMAHTMIGLKRLHSLRVACERVIVEKVPGDFIECGVWRGGACILMRGVLYEYPWGMRDVICADSFAGLPPPEVPGDLDLSHESYLAVSAEEVERNFKAYGLMDSRVILLKGLFKDTLPSLHDRTFSIVRLDGDMYQSTKDGLNNLYPRLSSGGYLFVDDYGAIHQCRRAVDEYREKFSITDKINWIDHSGIYWIKS